MRKIFNTDERGEPIMTEQEKKEEAACGEIIRILKKYDFTAGAASDVLQYADGEVRRAASGILLTECF